MAAVWRALRAWFARVGSDPYYASYERSLGNIKAAVERIHAARAARARAWAAVRSRFVQVCAAAYAALLAYVAYVNRQPPGSYTAAQQAARVAPAFAAPPLAWAVHALLSWLEAALDLRARRREAQLQGKLRKQVAELKDLTRYERTLALLQKYDPDYAPPKAERPAAARRGGTAPPTAVSRASGAALGAAGTALQGASARMLPALAQLYSRAAESWIADDPVTLSLLRETQRQADALRARLGDCEAAAARLLHDNIALKQQLGLPTEEEQAALAAWLGGGGATTSALPGAPGSPLSIEPTAVPEAAAGGRDAAVAAEAPLLDEQSGVEEGPGEGAADAEEAGVATGPPGHASDEADSDGFVAVTAAVSPSRDAGGGGSSARRRRGSRDP